MKKTNLIIDFSNIAMRSLFTCAYTSDGTVSTFDTDHECNMLVRKICTDIAYVMRLFVPDRTIIACDAKHPWRNDLYDPSSEEGYKSNRVKDNTKNWDKIFRTLNELKEVLKTKGFIVSEIPTAEGDDIAALWRFKQINDNDNTILVSSDKDWTQLISFNKNSSSFCICFNPISNNKGKKKLFCTEDFIDWMNNSSKADIFFTNYDPEKEELKNIKTKDSKVEFDVINPNKILLEKILCGDDGDNAPAFYQYYKNGVKTRITPKKAERICNDLNILTINDLNEACDANALKPKIEEVLKKELNDIDVSERLLRQRKLVELNPSLFPNDINSAFSYHLKNSENDGYIQSRAIKLDNILENTKYFDKNYNKPKENDIFKSLKELDSVLDTATAKSLF